MNDVALESLTWLADIQRDKTNGGHFVPIGSNGFYDDNLTALLDMIAQGQMRPVIDRVLPLDEAPEGLRLMQDRQVIGKVVVTP